LKVLIIGGGGREHAIAAAFARDMDPAGIFLAPGNAGIAQEFVCLPLRTNTDIAQWCLLNNPDMVFVGPEAYLAEGLADLLIDLGISCVGPSKNAAKIETSKVFAKNLMRKYQIPTAEYESFANQADACAYVTQNKKYPIVLKADGLAAGKGVVIAQNETEALEALRMLADIGDLPGEVVIEEFLEGWEVSVFAITDGKDFRTTLFVQDHKQIGDGDTGPNTGGMGAYCPVREAEPYRGKIEDRIISPVLQAMREESYPYQGFLYCGLMITAEGPKVLEFNCRLGDPEAQALLPLLKTSMIDVCNSVCQTRVKKLKLEWSGESSICVVLAAAGYPGTARKGDPIRIDRMNIGSSIRFSGVINRGNEFITNGGRVMSLVATAKDLSEAYQQIYRDIELVQFSGKTFRKDISMRINTLKAGSE
jgi:phosphoribosylamine---glycine ligase